MKKFMLVIAAYDDWRQEFYEKYTRGRNMEYCYRHGFEYIEINRSFYTDGIKPLRGNYTWEKYAQPLAFIDDGIIKEGDHLLHLDCDMAIVDGRVPLLSNKSYSYSIDSGNTHSAGLYTLKVNDWTYDLIKNILSDDIYKKLQGEITPDSMDGMSCWVDIFREMCVKYNLFGIKRHSWMPFWFLPHWGFHSSVTEHTRYSLEDLYKHVELLDTCWNVSILPEEDGMNQRFYINPTRKEDTIIRHFAGGVPWRKEYFERKMK